MNKIFRLSFETKLYFFILFFWNLPIISFFTLMFSESGLTASQITFCYMVSSVVKIICEVPFGIMADKFSRRNVLIMAIVADFIAVLAVIKQTFWSLFISNVFWGIVLSLSSGILAAFVYDELKADGRESEFSKIFGRTNAFQNIGLALGSIIAFFAVKHGYNILIFISLGSLVISLFWLLLIKETKNEAKVEDAEYFQMLKRGFQYSLKHKDILKISIFGALIGAIVMIATEFFSVFSKQAGWTKEIIALILFMQILIEATISFFSNILSRLSNRMIAGLLALAGLMVCIAASHINIFSPVFIFPLFILNVIRIIVLNSRKQALIPSHLRATISSWEGFLCDIFQVPQRIIFGLSATYFSYATGFLSIGIIAIASMFAFLFVFK